MRLILLAVLMVGTLARDHGPGRTQPEDTVCDPDDLTCKNTDPACGDCTIPRDSGTGCSVNAIETCVCAVDDWCCGAGGGNWDSVCVALVHEACGGEYCFIDSDQECAGTCGTASYGYGCSVPEIEECVCAQDSYCCTDQWDSWCLDLAWHSPCFTDCDCQGDDLLRGVDMPSYWSALASSFGLNETHLGFNCNAGKWCYSYSNTCVKWGEWNAACDDASSVCAGGDTYGYGPQQMALLAEMELSGDRRHFTCPDCTDRTPCPSGATRVTNDGPIYTDYACQEHFIGELLIENGYWWNEAEAAGVHAEHLSYFEQQWYDHETATCVAMGSYADPCDSAALGLVCAGANGDTFGAASDQMNAILAAGSNGGSHPACPHVAL